MLTYDAAKRITSSPLSVFWIGQQAMSEEAAASDLTQRIRREIQRELADMRDDRTVIVAGLNRLDASVTSLSAEVRALRNQFDRSRNEVRERFQKVSH